ncbi:hypothetical protein HDU83_005564 [Entophlyctis luteolus]|nr:hypothetical protein HDU83_005564 [Entophlyctis luteolus]
MPLFTEFEKVAEAFKGGEWHCKTPHKYIFDDVVPLAETILEGIRVWRPRRSLKLLKEEYGETALYSAEYRELDKMEKWKFDSKLKQWVK